MRRRAAVTAFMALCAYGAACGAVVGPDAPSSPVALFDQVWSDVDQHYSLFVVKGVNWDSLRTVFRPAATAASSNTEASRAISSLLAQLHDDHVTFRGSRVATAPHYTGPQPTLAAAYVRFPTTFANGLTYGWISSSIGYMSISTFDGDGWLSDVDSALTALDGVTSIIVDVRNNDGGYLENATSVAGRFADRTATVAYVRYRNGPAHTDFTSSIAQQVQPAGARRFAGRVYVLTTRNTVSAAELFVLSMRALGHTTVVGDTTRGETGSPVARELQNGWSYQFPESIEYTLDGREFENIGLPPDVTVLNSFQQIDRLVDAQLSRAIALASTHNP